MLRDLATTLVTGVVLGSLYALMAMGLTLVWGGLRILNLTLGSLYMLGAYTALTVGNIGLPPLAGLIVAFVAMGALGLLIYAGPLRALGDRPDRENSTLLVTFGLAIVLESAALLIFGPRNRDVPALVSGRIDVGGVIIAWNAVVITAIAVILLGLMGGALKWTRLGLSIRALAQQRDGAQLAGIGLHPTSALVMVLSSGLAGVGGTLLSSYYFVSPTVGANYLLIALIVTILGGLGSVAGTLYAAYVVGLIQAIVSFYVGTRWAAPALFTLIIFTLIVRPSGFAGPKVAVERL